MLAKLNELIYRDGIANKHDKQVREIRHFLIDHIESQDWFDSTSLTKMVNILNFAKPEAEEWDKASNDDRIQRNFCHNQTDRPRNLSDFLFSYSPKFGNEEEVRSRIGNIHLCPMCFDIDESLKDKSPEEIEEAAKNHIFKNQSSALKRFCKDMEDITEGKMLQVIY